MTDILGAGNFTCIEINHRLIDSRPAHTQVMWYLGKSQRFCDKYLIMGWSNKWASLVGMILKFIHQRCTKPYCYRGMCHYYFVFKTDAAANWGIIMDLQVWLWIDGEEFVFNLYQFQLYFNWVTKSWQKSCCKKSEKKTKNGDFCS